MEYWVFYKDIIHFNFIFPPSADHSPNTPVSSPRRRIYEPEAKTHFSLRSVGSTSRRPIFHFSNIPIGAKPLA
jgi:hypothetical protein